MGLVLHGYRYSVYQRIVRMVLAEKGLAYDRIEVNPFAADLAKAYLDLHPFGRVPSLVHDAFVLYETGAITRYLDEAFVGPTLQPRAARPRARMAQIISIVDAYGYVPMVRQVFSHRVFGPRVGRAADAAQIRDGLERSACVLRSLDALATDGGPLVEGGLSLADLHLAPMLAYFTSAPEGAALLQAHPRLAMWWVMMQSRNSLHETEPGLPEGPQ